MSCILVVKWATKIKVGPLICNVISPSHRPLPDNTKHSQPTSIPAVGSEPTIPGSEWPQTHTLDRTATEILIGHYTCQFLQREDKIDPSF
jgi:hypothetical protein